MSCLSALIISFTQQPKTHYTSRRNWQSRFASYSRVCAGQIIVNGTLHQTHSIYHAHYATALREVLRCSEVFPVERGHRVRPHKIRFPVVSDFRDDPWDPLNRAKIKSCQIGLTEHTALSWRMQRACWPVWSCACTM